MKNNYRHGDINLKMIDEALAKRHKYSLGEWKFVKHA